MESFFRLWEISYHIGVLIATIRLIYRIFKLGDTPVILKEEAWSFVIWITFWHLNILLYIVAWIIIMRRKWKRKEALPSPEQ